MSIDAGEPRELTTESFAQTPTFVQGERRIICMTAAHSQFPDADWWIMDRDGSHKLRLTYMTQRGHPQANDHRQLAGSIAVIGPYDFLGDALTELFGLTGNIVYVHIDPEGPPSE